MKLMFIIIMDHIMKNMKKIREMQKEQEDDKPKYTLSYIKLVSGKGMDKNCLNCDFKKECCSKCYDKLIHSISDVERAMIWTTPFNILLKDILKNSNMKVTRRLP
jgi:radical SAM protein with 4Fe4S-binding SPASM domain